MTLARGPRVFSIDPGTPFLETVARSLCDGSLIDGFAHAGDPLVLADVTIYVPTRRAARELRSSFLDVLNQPTTLLPTIRPLGEFDDDLDLFAGRPSDIRTVPPAIDPLNRQLLLGRLVLEWTKHLQADMRRRYGDETITTPVSTADAFWLANDLADVLDQLHAEDKTVSDVVAATDADVSDWWRVTLAFLEIIGSEWPAILENRSRIDPADHRNQTLRAEAARLRANPPDKPIIAAGSTGSIAATADLIKTIASLPKGAVVLPGFDPAMDGLIPHTMDKDIQDPSIAGHPQYGLYQLARIIGVDARGVMPLGHPSAKALMARRYWISESLKPAKQTQDWRRSRETVDAAAFDDVALLEAATEGSLAKAIAASMREALREPHATTALVTPDRTLAKRVCIELARHGINADDSAGTAFAETRQGQLINLLLQVVFEPGDPAAVLALLKHPLVRVGLMAENHRAVVTMFEHAVLRGGLGRFDPMDVSSFVERQLSNAAEAERKPAWLERFGSEIFETLRNFALRLDAAFAPLTALARSAETVTVQASVTATVGVLEQLVADDVGNHDPLYADEAGVSLEGFLIKLIEAEPDLTFPAHQWPYVMAALSASRTVRFARSGHPRVFIWGTLEARLQTVDHLVLGGLNEGTWPRGATQDAFLTRAQRTGIDLQPPERRIGLSAHDFQMAMGQKSVLLARALRADGAPTVASRWWLRLTTFAGPKTTQMLLDRGARLLAVAEAIEPPVIAAPALRPAPKPPLYVRPQRFSITEIDTLRSDPYAIYARRILGLRPTEPLIRDPNASERGSLIHLILERAVVNGLDVLADDASIQLEAVARQVFSDAELPQEIETLWWTRFEATIEPFITWERQRAGQVATRHAELIACGIAVEDTNISLSGRADRIDRRHDGLIDIIDYKTGTVPTKADITGLRSLQLPLEAALARHGAFEELGKTETEALIYLKIGARGVVDDKGQSKTLITSKDGQSRDLVSEAWSRTASLLRAYQDPERGYLARLLPPVGRFRRDYDHLARAGEWALADDGDGDG